MLSSSTLVGALPQAKTRHWRTLEIRAISSDSRKVQPGDLFVAIPGVAVDGHAFIPAALAAGATTFVVERMVPELQQVPTAIVPNAREALAYLYAAWHGFPGRQLRVIGVTGTDGKTTTVRLITEILRVAGHAVGRIDSVSASIAGTELDTGFHTTTPDAPELQAYLARMVSAGIKYAVLETTSHGLAQYRVAACDYDVAVVTNITHDHLDYHGTYEAYREAKGMLFRSLGTAARKPGTRKVAVLNVDDGSYDYLRAIPAEVRYTYGLQKPANLTARDVAVSGTGLSLVVQGNGLELPLVSSLIGRYNVYNILAASSVALSQGVDLEAIHAGVATTQGVTGRMERIERGQPFTVLVDFAHTPNALENALRTARTLTDKKVTVVFGCAGLRDRSKRPWMGEIAGKLADRVIITAEDPRTESLAEITEQVAGGCRRVGRREGEHFWRVADRAEAIGFALQMAQPGDVVIVTGKGHEQSMCFGTTEYPWSDHRAIGEALDHLGYSAT